MAAVHRCPRNIRSARSLRKRNDSEEENVVLDWTKSMSDNLQEILYHITRKDGVNKSLRLAYLNCFTKFCTKYDNISADSCGLTIDEIFCCLRVSLFHEAGEVRAAGLRAMRYLLRDEAAVESLCRVNLPILICRSIDIVLDNRLERIQALRLVRQLLSFDPKRFPPAFTYCLVAIAKDGIQERDIIVRACWATLTELTIMNPSASASAGGVSATIKSVLQPNQSHNISEALISTILYLLNSPTTRYYIRSDLDLQHFIAPITDVYCLSGESTEIPETRTLLYTASKNALITIIRSWPGFIYLCRTQINNQNNQNIPNGIESIINMLHLPYSETQRFILELLFELFYLKIPDWSDDFDAALISSDPSSMQDSWHLCDNFVAAEGKFILPHIAKHRLNLLNNYLALLLYSFVNYGLIDALVAVILNSNDSFCSVYSTVLLGELLHLSSCVLPSDCAHQCNSLPTLMAASTDESPKIRNLANVAISNLNRIHDLKKRGAVPCSLYLDQLMQCCQPVIAANNIINNNHRVIGKSKTKIHFRKNADEAVAHLIKNSQVLGREFTNWDWDIIDGVLKSSGDSMKKMEESHHKIFIKKLLNFYKPSSNLFSQISNTEERARNICIVGQHFIDFLIDAEEAKVYEYIEEFFVDLDNCFSQTAVETPPLNAILSPARLLSTLSHNYFLFIGRLTNSSKGRKWLEKTSIYQYFLDLINLSSNDVYMKLIVSSLVCANEENNFSRTLLSKVLTCSSESARLYATNYLRVLFRSGLHDFSKWAIELLVLQLYDKSSAVSLAALDVLDEALDCVENLEALISLRPSLLHIGDSGLLLLIRYLSLESGFKFLHDANFIDYELNRWQKSFNLKYVKIVEDLLNECFTCHQRSEDGTYGRRSDKKSTLPKNAFIPPHLYGQLSQTTEGYQILLNEDCLSPHYQTIRSSKINNELDVIKLKASLWAVGHVGATALGFQLINESDVIPIIVQMASDSQFLSIRGTCFYVLGLIVTTFEGSELLKEYGWESIRHSHHDKFPIVEEPLCGNSPIILFNESRRYTWSVSSTATKLDFMDIVGNTRQWDANQNDSFVYIDHNENENSIHLIDINEENLRRKKSSLPSIQSPNRKINLPRVASLSPNHIRTIAELRPRSSSDCDSIQKPDEQHDGIADDEDSSSGIWIGQQNKFTAEQSICSLNVDLKPIRHDSGLIADVNSPSSLALKTSALTVHELPKRKISEPGIHYGSLPREERSDSNESSQHSSGKSRSGSFADSTSGVSAGSCDSSSQNVHFSQLRTRNHNLSPIASLSSISNSTQSTIFKSLSPSKTFSKFSRLSSKSFISHSPSNDISNESIPTARDARGYAHIKDIQKRRVQSMGGGMLNCMESELYGMQNGDNYPNKDSRKSSLISLNGTNAEESHNITSDVKYLGLCLPINLNQIFRIEINSTTDLINKKESILKQEQCNWKTHLDRLTTDQLIFNNGLELHNNANCLLCFRNESKYNELMNETLSAHNKKQLTIDNENLHLNISTSEALDKTAICDNSNIPDQILNRREILRFVTNLCGAVHAKQAEQGLLSLKQKCPSAFEDLCLYSEICVQLATYNFRMTTRRFLQELFLDVNFDEIYLEADSILRQFASHVPLSSTMALNVDSDKISS